jgi:hypothetical protein
VPFFHFLARRVNHLLRRLLPPLHRLKHFELRNRLKRFSSGGTSHDTSSKITCESKFIKETLVGGPLIQIS